VDARRGEGGFTVIEMVVALTIMGFSLMTLATVQFSALKALGASRQRSAFVEIGNGVIEGLRSLPEAQVGVSSADPDLATAYPGNKHNGQDAVILTPAAPDPPPAVETVTSSPVKGISLPYTIRRWVTWDPGGDGADLRRLEVRVEWMENTRIARSLALTSVWYPGGKGTDPPANHPPVISSAAVTPSGGPVSTQFSFTSVATDPDGDGLSFSWQFGDGATGSGSTATHTYSAAGSYSALVTVKDTRGGQVTGSVNLVVAAPVNNPPTAAFSLAANSGSAPFTLNANGSASSDPDGDALTYLWNWGDGTTGSGVNAGHVYNSSGSYALTLTVTDTSGATSTAGPSTVTVAGGCAVLSASFKNPGSNATANDIKVTSTNSPKPINSQFVFTASTNLYCTSVLWSLQTTNTNQRYEVTGTTSSTTGGTKVWTVTDSIPNTHKFPLGALLTGFATSSTSNLSFQFNAHV